MEPSCRDPGKNRFSILWIGLPILAILATIMLAACTSGRSLSRDKAAQLIGQKMEPPLLWMRLGGVQIDSNVFYPFNEKVAEDLLEHLGKWGFRWSATKRESGYLRALKIQGLTLPEKGRPLVVSQERGGVVLATVQDLRVTVTGIRPDKTTAAVEFEFEWRRTTEAGGLSADDPGKVSAS